MLRNKQEYFGERYLVEIDDLAVEVWEILSRQYKGKDTYGLSLTLHKHRDLPLSTVDAQNLVAEFVSDVDPETRQSIIDALSSKP